MPTSADGNGRSNGCVDRIRQCAQRTREHLDELIQSDRERRVRERASAYFGRLLRRVRVVSPAELDDLRDEGIAAGTLDE
jgi:hypothetical protein